MLDFPRKTEVKASRDLECLRNDGGLISVLDSVPCS